MTYEGGEMLNINEEIIRFEGIGKRFGGVVALEDVSFSIKKGEIHAIVGENGAGKSTLMNILGGVFVNDSGKVYIDGKSVTIANPLISRELGIATVFQELMLCNNLDAAANIFLGHELKKGLKLDWKAMRRKARKTLDDYGLDFSETTQLKKLSAAQRQLLEIARALGTDAKILILDEPTSSLTENETRRLFDNVRKAKEKGVTIIFISHRLEEIFQIAERITVMRNGRYITTLNVPETDMQTVVTHIAGKEVDHGVVNRQDKADSEVVLEAKNLSNGNLFQNISFKLHKGEILGFYGLQGAGRTEMVETLFGLRRPTEGTVFIHGKEEKIQSPSQAIQKGMGFVTEDRKRTGIFALMSVQNNICIIHRDEIVNKAGFLQKKKCEELADEYAKRLTVKTASLNSKITTLSGGNQQKVLIARMLSMNPDIIIMDEPTRGVDVGAKAEIFKILRALRDEEGKSIIIIDSEIEEIMKECDRILVMRQGKISGELLKEEITKGNIMDAAFGTNELE